MHIVRIIIFVWAVLATIFDPGGAIFSIPIAIWAGMAILANEDIRKMKQRSYEKQQEEKEKQNKETWKNKIQNNKFAQEIISKASKYANNNKVTNILVKLDKVEFGKEKILFSDYDLPNLDRYGTEALANELVKQIKLDKDDTIEVKEEREEKMGTFTTKHMYAGSIEDVGISVPYVDYNEGGVKHLGYSIIVRRKEKEVEKEHKNEW